MAELEDKPKDDDEELIPAPLLHNPIQISKTDDEDTLVDVHVNNPLKKITKLLEDIKKQKAFSFSIKGSLGIAGIALVVTSFGIFGGTKAFCSRGTQTMLGTVQVLQITETGDESHPLLDQIKAFFWKDDTDPGKRTILVKADTSTIHLKKLHKDDAKKLDQKRIFATGEYDACSQRLTLSDAYAVQLVK